MNINKRECIQQPVQAKGKKHRAIGCKEIKSERYTV